jgi:hypothetical protein
MAQRNTTPTQYTAPLAPSTEPEQVYQQEWRLQPQTVQDFSFQGLGVPMFYSLLHIYVTLNLCTSWDLKAARNNFVLKPDNGITGYFNPLLAAVSRICKTEVAYTIHLQQKRYLIWQ